MNDIKSIRVLIKPKPPRTLCQLCCHLPINAADSCACPCHTFRTVYCWGPRHFECHRPKSCSCPCHVRMGRKAEAA